MVKPNYTFDRQLMLEREDSREEGRKEVHEDGREEMAELAVQLIKTGRADDIEKCKDAAYRNKLLKEFHLTS